jgi:hypothetical protein
MIYIVADYCAMVPMACVIRVFCKRLFRRNFSTILLRCQSAKLVAARTEDRDPGGVRVILFVCLFISRLPSSHLKEVCRLQNSKRQKKASS